MIGNAYKNKLDKNRASLKTGSAPSELSALSTIR